MWGSDSKVYGVRMWTKVSATGKKKLDQIYYIYSKCVTIFCIFSTDSPLGWYFFKFFRCIQIWRDFFCDDEMVVTREELKNFYIILCCRMTCFAAIFSTSEIMWAQFYYMWLCYTVSHHAQVFLLNFVRK